MLAEQHGSLRGLDTISIIDKSIIKQLLMIEKTIVNLQGSVEFSAQNLDELVNVILQQSVNFEQFENNLFQIKSILNEPVFITLLTHGSIANTLVPNLLTVMTNTLSRLKITTSGTAEEQGQQNQIFMQNVGKSLSKLIRGAITPSPEAKQSIADALIGEQVLSMSKVTATILASHFQRLYAIASDTNSRTSFERRILNQDISKLKVLQSITSSFLSTFGIADTDADPEMDYATYHTPMARGEAMPNLELGTYTSIATLINRKFTTVISPMDEALIKCSTNLTLEQKQILRTAYQVISNDVSELEKYTLIATLISKVHPILSKIGDTPLHEITPSMVYQAIFLNEQPHPPVGQHLADKMHRLYLSVWSEILNEAHPDRREIVQSALQDAVVNSLINLINIVNFKTLGTISLVHMEAHPILGLNHFIGNDDGAYGIIRDTRRAQSTTFSLSAQDIPEKVYPQGSAPQNAENIAQDVHTLSKSEAQFATIAGLISQDMTLLLNKITYPLLGHRLTALSNVSCQQMADGSVKVDLSATITNDNSARLATLEASFAVAVDGSYRTTAINIAKVPPLTRDDAISALAASPRIGIG